MTSPSGCGGGGYGDGRGRAGGMARGGGTSGYGGGVSADVRVCDGGTEPICKRSSASGCRSESSLGGTSGSQGTTA